MAGRQRYRLRIDQAAFVAQARPSSYAIVNALLAQYAILGSGLAMRPAKLLVFLTIVVSSVQRSMRVRPLPETQMGETPLPIEAIGFSSRRSLAEATGLPRETVRRYVDELIADGRLLVDSRGRVAHKPLLLAAPKGRPAVTALLSQSAIVAELLIDLGVLVIEPVAPAQNTPGD